MAVGQGALLGGLSYIAVGRETTFGTYNTCTAAIECLSFSLKTSQEDKILESIQSSRTYGKQMRLGRKVEGDAEFYFGAQNAPCNYLLQNAFGGGTITSATATGETASGLAWTHTVSLNNFVNTYSSLCINSRKGDSSNGKLFLYSGLRVNELSFKAELDDALICTASMIGKDSTTTGTDVESVIAGTSFTQNPLSFINGRLSVESALASLTTSSFWHIQSMEFKVKNNLKSERRIGTDTVDILPPGMAMFDLQAKVRFDTTTAYDAMKANTQFACEFEFLGSTLTGSAIREGLKIQMPRVFIKDAGEPEISGPDEILTSDVTFSVLRELTTTGYAVRALVTNLTASY